MQQAVTGAKLDLCGLCRQLETSVSFSAEVSLVSGYPLLQSVGELKLVIRAGYTCARVKENL